MLQTDTPISSKRAENMARRRSVILAEARSMIAQDGFESLKLRDLAQRAKVTVPTIYNLIGGKDEILGEIIEDLVARLLVVQQADSTVSVEARFEARINRVASLLASDENYYRAAFIAGDRGGLFEQSSPSGIYARSLAEQVDTCTAAISAGLLRGEVSAQQMGAQIYGCYRLARQDWMNGYFGLQGFKREALTGVFLSLAADATPAFKKRLLTRLAELEKA